MNKNNNTLEGIGAFTVILLAIFTLVISPALSFMFAYIGGCILKFFVGDTFEILDRYLRTGEIDDLDVKAKIDLMHKRCLFKSEKIPVFNPGLKVEVA